MKNPDTNVIKSKILLICLVILCIAVRLYKIDSPVGDWHSWRQADTAAVARNFITVGFDPLRPRYDDLSNIQSGKDNPNGWRMVEFPLYQSLAFFGYSLYSGFPIEIWLRIVSIIASVGSGLILFDLVSRRLNVLTGLVTFFLYAILPFNVFYSRAILPEILMVFFSLLGLAILNRYTTGNRYDNLLLIAGAVSCSLSLLVKPTAIFLHIPALYLILSRDSRLMKKIWHLVMFIFISALPVLLWRDWIQQYPEGIPVFDWLFNKDNIRFKGAWFYWLFADRIGRLILGFWGLVFFGVGLLSAHKKNEGFIFWLFLLGCLAYFVVIAGGNVQHDYYQILIVPVLCIFMAKGIVTLLTSPIFSRVHVYLVGSTMLLFAIAFSWYTIRTYYWINRQDLLAAGRAAHSILPLNAKVIAPNNGDTTFLYFIQRQGWPLGFDIDKKIAMGATHYVTVSVGNDFETQELMQKYKVLEVQEHLAIIEF